MKPRALVALATLVLLLISPALAQVGVKDMVKRQIQNAEAERDRQAQQAGDANPYTPAGKPGQSQPAPSPAVVARDPNKDTGWLDYKAPDGTKVRLYVAHPHIEVGKAPNLPALVVIQEWWGVNDDITQRTDEFAGKGYFALAVDLYDGKSTRDPKEAAQLKAGLKDAVAIAKLKAGLAFLNERVQTKTVDPTHIAAVGWCMGGTHALQLATQDSRIKALTVFYPGSPELDPAKLKNIQGPVFGVFGNTDKNPNPAAVDKLDKALTDLKIPHEFHRYDGVGHAFASRASSATGAYNEEKAKEAWSAFYAWLDKTLPTKK